MYKNVIFDLDGTLMDTLDDIKDAMNEALKRIGHPYTFTYEEAKKLIGSGARVMIERAIYYGGANPSDVDKLGETFLPLYKEYQGKTTKPYDGMIEVMKILKERGYKLYILTNKPQHLMNVLVNNFFIDYLDGYQGQVDSMPCKPDVKFTNYMLDRYNLNKEECIFVGDSNIDVLVGKNACMDTVLCLYGYGDEATKNDTYPKYKIESPLDLLKILD